MELDSYSNREQSNIFNKEKWRNLYQCLKLLNMEIGGRKSG